MRQSRVILGCLVLGLAAAILLVALRASRSDLSMTLVEYRRWPHGATLQLANNSERTVRYLMEPNATPAGGPLLREQQTSEGWLDQSSFTVRRGLLWDVRTATSSEAFALEDAWPPLPGQRRVATIAHDTELKAGERVRFFVRLEPDGSPVRVGTVCVLPESPIVKKVRPYLNRWKKWVDVDSIFPRLRQVWCVEPLQVSSSQGQGSD